MQRQQLGPEPTDGTAPIEAPQAAPAAEGPAPLSVTQLSNAIRGTLERALGHVRVRGEISNFKLAASGHCYLRLKDEGACLDAVIWRREATVLRAQLGSALADGLEVVAEGRITTWAERSSYQLVIDRLSVAGAGALLAMIEERRRRLAAEGLFAPERKRPLPFWPRTIGVVTSPTGAVIRDIITTVGRRCPTRIVLWPVPVQGAEAARQIVAAIQGFDRLPADGETDGAGLPRPDVLIVGRGGGSLEELMVFNDEAVVRAAAACRIPLISAVGHETDTTLIDFAADRRAPTPTAAAELATPLRSQLAEQIEGAGHRLHRAAGAGLRGQRLRLAQAGGRLASPKAQLIEAAQRLEARAARRDQVLAARLGRARLRLAGLVPRPPALDPGRERVAGLALRRDRAGQLALTTARGRLEALAARLEAASYRQTLARGFALVLDEAGQPVTRAAALAPVQAVRLAFADGERAAMVGGGGPAPRPRGKTAAPPAQPKLL